MMCNSNLDITVSFIGMYAPPWSDDFRTWCTFESNPVEFWCWLSSTRAEIRHDGSHVRAARRNAARCVAAEVGELEQSLAFRGAR